MPSDKEIADQVAAKMAGKEECSGCRKYYLPEEMVALRSNSKPKSDYLCHPCIDETMVKTQT